MENKFSLIGSIIGFLIIAIGLAVFGWSTLPEHDAKAARTAALIPYLEQQQAIRTDELYRETELKLDRAAAVQGYKITAQTAFYAMVFFAIVVFSSYGLHVTHRHGQRVTRQMALPVMKEAGNYLILGDGERAFVVDRLTGQMTAAFTQLEGNDSRAQIMERLLVTQALAQGAAAVAKETKDPSTADYLLGQMENITNGTIQRTHDAAAHPPIFAGWPASSTVIQGDQAGDERPGNAINGD